MSYQQPPPGGPGGYPPPPGNQPAPSSSVGFFGALFDFSFTYFVTPKIVKFVYILALVALAIGYVIFVITGFASDEPIAGLFFLIIGAIGFLIYLAFIRMTLEIYYAVVRMSEDINRRLPGA
jgi:hypothetical protein